MNEDMKKMMPYILAWGGAGLTLIGCILPFYSLLGISISFMQTGLAFVIILFMLLGWAALATVEYLKKMPILRWGCLCAGIAFLVTILNVFTSGGIGIGGLSIGAFVMILGEAAGVAGGVLGFMWNTGNEA